MGIDIVEILETDLKELFSVMNDLGLRGAGARARSGDHERYQGPRDLTVANSVGSPMCTAFSTSQRINNTIRDPVTVAGILKRDK